MADELGAGPVGALAGRLGVTGGGRSAGTAFALGIAGTGLFVASLLLDWLQIDLDAPGSEDTSVALDLEGSAYGVVYLLGVLGLLTMLGAVVVRPALAERLRFAAAGLGVGVLAVVAALTVELTGYIERQILGMRGSFVGGIPEDVAEVLDRAVYTPLPGVFLAGATIVALVAGVWLAALPAVGADRVTAGAVPAAVPYVLVPAYPASPDLAVPAVPMPVSAAPVSPVPTSSVPVAPGPTPPPAAAQPVAPAPGHVSGPAAHWLAPVGRVDGLTVTSSGAIDTGSPTDILRT